MALENGAKYERKYLAHYIDAAFNSTTPNYTRLGKDLEEYSIALNPEVETKTNILGESSTNVKGYAPQGSVSTYYAYKGDPLYTQLKKIIDERLTGNGVQTTVVDVVVDDEGNVESAYRENAVVVPQSIGGSDGIQIPFEIYYVGERTKGTFDVSKKTFTADTAS
ncbi:MAG: hypothetical protein E7547_02880 [Ruminococcaceae bacterium]|nr:hypothetical protein [Oscillospiraceae bacterium]